MSDLTIFQFEQNEVRFIGTADDPWWVAADVCIVLEIAKPENAYARLDEDEKDTRTVGTLGGKQKMICVNESGLYSLIFVSRKPQAKRFKKWVTSVVLPSIRKTGKYELPQAEQQSPQPQEPHLQPPAVPTPEEIALAVNLVLGGTDLHPNLKAGAIGSAIGRVHPQLLPAIEAAKTLLPIPIESELVRPTALALKLTETTGDSWSAVRVNKVLIEQGFQVKNPDGGSDPAYLPTPKGKEHSELVVETAKGHGRSVQSLRWHLSVLEALEANDH